MNMTFMVIRIIAVLATMIRIMKIFIVPTMANISLIIHPAVWWVHYRLVVPLPRVVYQEQRVIMWWVFNLFFFPIIFLITFFVL